MYYHLNFNNVFESFEVFTSFDKKEQGVPDFRCIKPQTFTAITNLIDFVNTDI